MISKDVDILLTKELDEIAQSMGYIDEARLLLEDAFLGVKPPRKKRAVPLVSAAVGLAAAASIAWILLTPNALEVSVGKDGRALPVGAWVSSSMSRGEELSFSDGSTVNLFNNSEVRLQTLTREGAHLLLERGKVSLLVVHQANTDWRLDAGPYKIAVTGTRFSAQWVPDSKEFNVRVHEGSVEVDGPMLADGKVLSTGDRLTVSLLDKEAKIYKKDTYERIVAGDNAGAEHALTENDISSAPDETQSPQAERLPPVETSVKHQKKTVAYGATSAGTRWKTLARKGEWRDALKAAEKRGMKSIVSSAPLSDLMLLGDAARLAKHHSRALQVYKAVRDRFPRTSEAQRAAFTMGRIEFETHRNYKKAAFWFKTCLADNAEGTMAREAFGRLVEVLDKSGNRSSARNAARKYLATYRNGPHAELAKQILSRP